MKIGFWKTSKDNFCVTHTSGLTPEQISVLHNLKVGDRLGMWINDRDNNNSPYFSLHTLKEELLNENDKTR